MSRRRSRRSRSSFCVWLKECCCCCCCCCRDDPQGHGLMNGTSPRESIQSEEGFSELSVTPDAKGDGEIQKQEVVLREESHTPQPQRGERIHQRAAFLRDKEPRTHSGSFVRNSGARLSWRMLPSEARRSESTSEENSNPEDSGQEAAVVAAAEAVDITEDKEVVLREVEDEQLLGTDLEETGAVFSSIIAISTTESHNRQQDKMN